MWQGGKKPQKSDSKTEQAQTRERRGEEGNKSKTMLPVRAAYECAMYGLSRVSCVSLPTIDTRTGGWRMISAFARAMSRRPTVSSFAAKDCWKAPLPETCSTHLLTPWGNQLETLPERPPQRTTAAVRNTYKQKRTTLASFFTSRNTKNKSSLELEKHHEYTRLNIEQCATIVQAMVYI